MKNIYSLILLLITVIAIPSCKKFLDRPPLDTITDKEMAFSKTEMELYSNQYYTSFPNFLDAFYADNSSDNMVHGNYNYNALLSGIITVPSSDGGWSWGTIRSVNYFLANYHVTTEPFAEIKTYVGEMYFWRAWYYFGMLKSFGDLPWYNKPLGTNSEELYAPRLPRNVVADSILASLDKAIELLNDKNTAATLRLNKDVARTFKSRVALYEGTWEKYHQGTPFGVEGSDYNKYFQQAAAAAQQVINGNNYQIVAGNDPQWDYWNLFNRLDLSGNTEVILWRKYSLSQSLTHQAQNYLLYEGGNTGLSKQLVDSYLGIDGKPIALSPLYKGDDSIAGVVQNRDPRLRQTIFVRDHPMVIQNGDTVKKFSEPFINMSGESRNTTGYQLFKGAAPNIEPQGAGPGSGAGATTAAILFRYAEVLLNYAEAHAELGTCTQQVLDASINKLRDKVAMPHMTVAIGFADPAWDFPQLSALLNEIRRERRVELACEGFRYDDLFRWAATDLIKAPLKGAKYAQFVGKTFNPPLSNIPVSSDGYIFPYLNSPASNGWQFDKTKNYLRPLPVNEMTLNNSLKQNPGY
ncbi:RagB/SusD family nutrient uptake outer membrane protein [Flavitalea sp.]|nr:RagB/SusD family nutrient uptake outer membrane protein [Flavitalea sp.]